MKTYEQLNKLLHEHEHDTHVFINKNLLQALELKYGSYTIQFDDINIDVYNYENLVRPILKIYNINNQIWLIM